LLAHPFFPFIPMVVVLLDLYISLFFVCNFLGYDDVFEKGMSPEMMMIVIKFYKFQP
jgi:hypothetical protein